MKKVKFIYNPNSGDKRIKNEIDTIIQIYQAYDYCVVPYRLTKTRPNEDAFWADGSFPDFLKYSNLS